MSVVDPVAETVYPSLAATGSGRLMGRLLNLLPIRIGRVRLTHLLFGALLAPIAPVFYVLHKMTGRRYRLTQSTVEDWPMVGDRSVQRVDLDRITDIATRTRRGQRFYRAGDVILHDADGNTLLTLAGVPQPERVARLIEQLRQAQRQRDAAAATIAARVAS